MKREFRTMGKYKTWKFKNAGCVYNDSNGIEYLSSSEIILRKGFKPVKSKTGYINIVKVI
jgi:hypothetical protein